MKEEFKHRSLLEWRIARRENVLSRLGLGKIQEGQSWENDLKLARTKEKFQGKIENFRQELDDLAMDYARNYSDSLLVRQKQFNQLRELSTKGFLSLGTFEKREEELRLLIDQPQQDPFLQRGFALLEAKRRSRKWARKGTEELAARVKKLRLDPRGLTAKEIAEELGVSSNKVENLARLLIQRGEISKQKQRKRQGREILSLIKELTGEHPEVRASLSAVGDQLKLTRERVRQLFKEEQKGIQFRIERKGERINLFALTRMVRTSRKTLIELLKQGRISLGNADLDQFALDLPSTKWGRKFILPQNLDLEKISQEAQNYALYHPSRLLASRDHQHYSNLSEVAREAGLKTTQNIPFIAQALAEAGFSLFKFPKQKEQKEKEYYYHFVLAAQREEIVAYLKRTLTEKT